MPVACAYVPKAPAPTPCRSCLLAACPPSCIVCKCKGTIAQTNRTHDGFVRSPKHTQPETQNRGPTTQTNCPRQWEHLEGRGPNEWLLEPRPKAGVGTQSYFLKIGSLTDSTSVPNRSTVAIYRERANTNTKTTIIGKLSREGVSRNTQNRVNRTMGKSRNFIAIGRHSKLSNIRQNRNNPLIVPN